MDDNQAKSFYLSRYLVKCWACDAMTVINYRTEEAGYDAASLSIRAATCDVCYGDIFLHNVKLTWNSDD